MSGEHFIGVDLGGTKALAGVFADGVKPLARAKEPTPYDQGPAAVVATIGKLVDDVLLKANVAPESVRALGFSVPGQVNPSRGFVKFAPNLGWSDVELVKLLPAKWSWPTFIENDVRIGTFAEWKSWSASRCSSWAVSRPGNCSTRVTVGRRATNEQLFGCAGLRPSKNLI